MELIECEGEAEFHTVTNMNHEEEGEVLDLEQGSSNPSSNYINGE